jgi:competence protein ComER
MSNRLVAELSDVIFLCVRPLEIRDVLPELSRLLTPNRLLVSVAQDVPLSTLHNLRQPRVARILPSMPSERLQGMTLPAFGDNTTTADRCLVADLFHDVGDALEANEKDFGILADLTSSAPEYIDELLSEFVLAAERKGISSELGERLVKQTCSLRPCCRRRNSFQDLITSIATKGGITEEGVKVILKDAPEMFDQLFTATEARHELVKRRLGGQSISK